MHHVIVVLGDIGRSPRMQYHTHSLLTTKSTDTVTLVGYEGETLIPSLRDHPRLTIKPLYSFTSLPRKWYFLPLKALLQCLFLCITLLTILTPHTFLVQNPPT